MKISKSKQIYPQQDPSKNVPAHHQKAFNQPYKNEAPTVSVSSFGGMKMQIICNGCYLCCLVHCCELFRCDCSKYSVLIYTEQKKNIYEMSYSIQEDKQY